MSLAKHDWAGLLTRSVRVAPAIFFLLALAVLGREVSAISGARIWADLLSIDPGQWALAFVATLCGYAVLTLYDVLGLRILGARLPYRSAAKGAFLSFTISHNVGLGWLSGGSMRQRVYGPLGIELGNVARLTILNSVTFFIGAFVLLGAVLVGEPEILAPLLPLAPSTVQFLGLAFWAATILYLVMCARRRRPIGWGKVSLPVPGPWTAVAQIILSTADIMLAAVALYVLLPPGIEISFAWLLGVYIVALGASVLTHVPGGVGILEGLILLSLPDVPKSPLLAAMIAYRVAYYLVPLAIALAMMSGGKIRSLSRNLLHAARSFRGLVPLAASVLCLAAGTALLLSGATPGMDARMSVLRAFLPLPLLELSHLAGSLVGLALVVLSGALYRRYDTARSVAIILLLAGSAAMIVNGGAVIQALVLAALALVVTVGRSAFYRRGSIWRNAISPASLVLGLVMVAASIWAGLQAFSEVAYRHELWWQFAYDAGAPRFLRASLVVSVMGLGLLLARLLGPAPQRPASDQPNSRIREVVAMSEEAGANLALVGDKRFLTSESARSFLMYQIEGRSWISMGDPIGPRREWAELIWRFRECADAAGGKPVFYEVLGEHLSLYADAGLAAHKIGEEARIELAAFTLDTPKSKPFRAILRRAERDGLSFAIIPSDQARLRLKELKQISDQWLSSKRAAEKGFSLGYFDPLYLARFECAVVTQNGRVVAFANIWRGAGRKEISMDLMRFRPDAPRGAMLFLMLQLILWAQKSGYIWFNLGMAPLAGLAHHRLAPIWHCIGRLIFSHGEKFYGFVGLRQFKEQFLPVWRPRYVACRPGLPALALALGDCARLISRPVRADRLNRRVPAKPAGHEPTIHVDLEPGSADPEIRPHMRAA